MENPFDTGDGSGKSRAGKRRKSSFWLDLDAWIDSALYEWRFSSGQVWEDCVIFFRRFRPMGFKKVLAEIFGEGFMLGTFGALLMLALAIPASDEISSNWRTQDEFAVTFLDRYGNEIGRRGILHSDAVPIDELPDHLVQAVLATEDRRFFEHYGIDLFGLARAMNENVRANSVVQGGSTITQQLAKNLFLSNERTIDRKLKEVFLALWLEANLSKDEILKLYLDRAYMGGGTFGIAAAAQFYFDRNPRELTLAQSAILAGLFKAPAKYAPHINLPAARARANEVLTNMVQAGFMTEGQVTAARREPADVVIRAASESPDYFLDWAFEEVKAFMLANAIPTRSVIVRTTVDKDLQQAAEEATQFHLRQYGSDFGVTQSASVVIENNGAVRAMVGGRDYGESQFNRATSALRQSGSSFKPYVYAAALQAGLRPDSRVVDAPVTWRGWSPQNYNRSYSGRTTLANALARSINTVPVFLARDIIGGTGPIVQLARDMGVESDVISHHTMVLGTSDLTVMDQATGYLTFAAHGKSGLRHAFTQILSSSGEILYDRRDTVPEARQTLSPDVAEAMNQMLVNVTEWGTGRRAALTEQQIRVAGKTGTTQSYRDAWFVGYTGNFTTAVWYGNDDNRPTERLTGGRLPAQTWHQIMAYAHQGIDLLPMAGVENSIPAVAPGDGDENGDENDPDALAERLVLSRDMQEFLVQLQETLVEAQGDWAEPAELARNGGVALR